MRAALVLGLLLLTCLPAYGQTNSHEDLEVGFVTGPLLPSRFQDITDVMPFWGLRFGHPWGSFRPEYTVKYSHAHGADYFLFSGVMRNSIGGPKTGAFWTIGFDIHRYQKNGSSLKMFNGWKIGFGGFMPEQSMVRFRTDFAFSIIPGRSLFVGLGFHMRLGEGAAKEAQ